MSGTGTAVKAVVLGLKPFILVEFSLPTDGREALEVDITSGGGVTHEDIPGILLELGTQFSAESDGTYE